MHPKINQRYLRRIGSLFLFAAGCCMMIVIARTAEKAPKPLYPNATPVCPCENLTKVAIPNVTIDAAVIVRSKEAAPCVVLATVTHPPYGGRVKVFLVLPTKGWNGRFRGVGGGGFVGGYLFHAKHAAELGYAAGGTDGGHEGDRGNFALDENGRLNWQGIVDFAYRAVHDMTVVGKALTEAYYGKPPRYSYFTGLSTGGRQGLVEAQRYPDDYDGILAAAPAINIPQLNSSFLWPQLVMLEANNFLPVAKLRAVTDAAIAACDELDGIKDGVVDDPWRCTYDPRQFVNTRVGEGTFTESDAQVVQKIWEGPRNRDGSFLWYGLARGANLSRLAEVEGSPLAGKPAALTLDWFRFFLLQDPHWNWTTITPARFEMLSRQAVEEYAEVLGSDNPDLTRFRDRGGKIILYHGLVDEYIPAEMSIDYFKRVQQRMGGPDQTTQFFRLFLAPGVDHGFSGGGPLPTGPDPSFGGGRPLPTGEMDALIRWVEEGRAPDMLLTERRDPSGKLLNTRPLFPYPRPATRGTGSPDQ